MVCLAATVAAFHIYAVFSSSPPTSSSSSSSSNFLYSYDPSNNSWNRVGEVPGIPSNCALKDFAMVALESFVFIIGGRMCCADSDDGNVISVRDDVIRYDCVTGEWSTCAPLKTPRFDFACAISGGKIHVAGGQIAVTGARGTSVAEVYDPAEGTWTDLPGMIARRHKCAGVDWRGRFYVVGGFAERDNASEDDKLPYAVVERSSAEVYDEELGKWELIQGMWQLDVPPNQIVAVGDKLFSSGDCLSAWKGYVESFDADLGIWNIVRRSQIKDLASLIVAWRNEPETVMQRVYLTMASVGTTLYFIAGYRKTAAAEDSKVMTVVHTFETSAGVVGWRSMPPVVEEEEKKLGANCCVVNL